MLVSYRLLPPLIAAERLARVLGRLVRPGARGPELLDPAELSPHLLRDIGLPEDCGRRSRASTAHWSRPEHRR
jgi:hypothetical protein